MSNFSFFQTKTSGTDQMTVRKDDKEYVLVPATLSTETKETPQTALPASAGKVSHLQQIGSLLAARKSSGLSIVRLPSFVANLEVRSHTFRYSWLLPTTASSIPFGQVQIACPLVVATSTTAGIGLSNCGRLRRGRLMWVNTSTTLSLDNPPEIAWVTTPDQDHVKCQQKVPSVSSLAGAGDLTFVPPKNSFHSMWQNSDASTNSDLFRIVKGVTTATMWVVLDLEIDWLSKTEYYGTQAFASLTGATSGVINQLVPPANGSVAGESFGYPAALY
jgi:hypothetical protein